MTISKSFQITLRWVFVLFSLQFLKDAFFRWDGYSFYMRFIEFLPDLSLVYILWTLVCVAFALVIWLSVFFVSRLIPLSLVSLRLEYAIFSANFILLPLLYKRLFYQSFSVSEFTGLSKPVMLLITCFVLAVIFFSLRKRSGNIIVSLIAAVNSRITPLVWIFAFLFIFSIPLSLIKDNIYLHEDNISKGRVDLIDHVSRPNIILVSMDALTSLDMQVYGYKRPTTPFISEWAKDAVVFNRYYAASNWTSPTNMSMMTGQRVWTHGVWYRTKFKPVNDYNENMPRVLKDHGYDVYGFVQNIYAHPKSLGIHKAFSSDESHLSFKIIPDNWFNKVKYFFETRPVVQEWFFLDNPIAQVISDYQPDIIHTLVPSEKVYGKFLELVSENRGAGLKRDSNRPFFAWLHVFPPHEPYLAPDPLMGVFGDEGKFETHKKQYMSFNFNSTYLPDRQGDIDILRKRYDEFILYSDRQFELFLSSLAKVVDMSNTVIILSADHGESFNHGWLAHDDDHLYESLVHVPLIIKLPDDRRGRVNMPVSQIDLAPTILDIVDIPIPEWMEGRSLRPLLKGESLKEEPVFSMQFLKNRSFNNPITKGTIAVWDGDYKLIYYLEDERLLLFNLKDDPDEIHNLVNDLPELTVSLKKMIDNKLAEANKELSESSNNN